MAAPETSLSRGQILGLVAMGVAVLVVANDFTALSVAIPAIEQTFGVGLDTAQWVINGYAMVFGVLGAASHHDVRKILSFHIISQIGYMLVGIALMTPLAIAGSILYITHHIVVKANLFLLAGAIRSEGGSFHLSRLGGLWIMAPMLAILFLVPALSLAGVPPFSGFWAKLVVIRSSLEGGAVIVAFAALSVGLLTLYSMVKIWNEAFWKAAPADAATPAPLTRQERIATYVPITVLAAITLSIGLWAEPFARLSMTAAESLLDRTGYISAVLGAVPTQVSEVLR